MLLGGIALGAPRLSLAVRSGGGDEEPLTVAGLAQAATAACDANPGGHMFAAYPASEPLPTLRVAGSRLIYVPRQYQLYAVDLTMGFDAYQAKFSSKSRSTLRRKIRKFAERTGGTVDWRQYTTPTELEEFYRLARDVSARTYQERKLDAGLPGGDAFRADMHVRGAEGRARGYLLFLDGEAVSYIYCPIDDGVLSYAHVGYDPKIADLSPGTVLQWHVLEALFAEKRHRVFDFTQGEGDHKRFFSTEARQCANVVVLPFSLRGWAVVLAQFLCDRVSTVAGDALDRIGLKRAIRRVLRR
jgi:CelD/BcsL family acetyltransferase involved in cellulose biosynthesis